MTEPAFPRVPHAVALYLALGLLFAMLAVATLVRMAMMVSQRHKLPEFAPVLNWAPIVLWFAGGALFIALAARPRDAAI